MSTRGRSWFRMLVAAVGAVGVALAVVVSSATSIAGAQEPTSTTTETTAPGSAEEATTTIGGTLRTADQEPVPDVDITVTDADGEVVDEVTSDDEGVWEVELESGGRYTVTLDQESLPEGVTLRDPERDTVERNVREGRSTFAIFQFGEGERETVGTLDRVLQAGANGLKVGLIIAMAAIGLSLIFGTSGLINFAHGELVTFGAVAAWFLNTKGLALQLIGAAVIAIILTGLLSGALERGLWRPLRGRQVGLFQLLVISIGLSLLMRHGIQLFFGGGRRRYTDYVIGDQVSLGPVTLAERDLWIMAISAVILVAVATLLQRTRMGTAMRAVADNVDLAESSGIDVQRVLLLVWVVGGGLAATGGVLLGATEGLSYVMGFRLLLLMFAAVILGGLGTAYGAMVGAIVIGLVTELSVVWVPAELKIVFALLALIIVLLVRPQGILGIRERIG